MNTPPRSFLRLPLLFATAVFVTGLPALAFFIDWSA